MSLWRYIARGLMHHWRVNGAVALSVAAATAVLTGALLIGDSVRASLRRLTLDRLGGIDQMLASDRFFREQLAPELSAADHFARFFQPAVPAILFPRGTVERSANRQTHRATSVLILGCGPSFWRLADASVRPRQLPANGEVVLNQPLADDLAAKVGDEVVLRLAKSDQVPADSPLANKSDRTRNLAGLKVVSIIPARSLGQFNVRPSQTVPRNAFVSLGTIQQALNLPGEINTIFLQAKSSSRVSRDETQAADDALRAALRPSFADYGFHLKHVRQVFPEDGSERPQVIYDYYSLTTDRMVFAPEAEAALRQALKPMRGQAVFTYLANSLEKISSSSAPETMRIPYSMVTAIDPSDGFPLRDLKGQLVGPLPGDKIVLNHWAAQRLHAQTDDRVRMEFFAPETTHGQAVERSADFTVKAITPLTEPAEPFKRNRSAVYRVSPALANDPDLTPEVKGVTDQETIDDWDAPFPFHYARVRDQDETYWADHRTTPKAFLALAKGQQLWGSRFGRVTSFRLPAGPQISDEQIKQRVVSALARTGTSLGFHFAPVKRQQLAASQGTTPFDLLFLALSFFIIAAAVMLVALLFRLGVEQRAAELGTLLAVGFRRRRAAALLMLEAVVVAALGGLLGIAIGIAYAHLMLYGLRTWWIGAITAPFVRYAATPQSLVSGYVLGVLISLLSVAWTVYSVRRIALSRLLAGQLAAGSLPRYRQLRWARGGAWLLALAALALLVVAARKTGMIQALAFVGGGGALLAALLVGLWARLKRGGAVGRLGRMGLAGLAWRNAARNPLRSALTMGLIATASFLIVATQVFRLAPSDRGVGGFDLVAETAEPVFADLNSRSGRSEWLGEQADALAGSLVFGLRLRGGDDASCNNLYQPSQPRVIGVTREFIHHFDDRQVTRFAWASTAAKTRAERANAWRLLAGAGKSADAEIPVVVDMNTALYSLKPPVSVGSIYTATYPPGKRLRFRVVGLLENSMLQGSLMIGEADFERCFPEVSGYRYFLVKTPAGKADGVAAVLEDRLGDQGLDAVPARQVLAQLLAVQNAYLSTFQSLGALGLLFGTFGLATVQLRNVVERRGELALLRAAGFRAARLAQLVLLENVSLLAVGLLAGVVAALLAVLPHKLLGDASIPASLLRDLLLMLGAVFLIGLIASFAAVRAALRAPLLAALREE